MEQTIKEAKGAQMLTNQLRATLDADGKVQISGLKDRVRLPHNSGSHRFKFILHDETQLNVRFSALGTQVGEVCPRAPGDNTGQIIDVDIDDRKAEFTDKNSGDPLTFGYTWFFVCNDATQQPTFDPIVDNGGGGDII